jgi:serine/threonine protein kinase
VKKVRDDDREKIIAHEREFEILKPLKHKNVVSVIEIYRNEFKNEIYQVMEYVEGSEILDEIAQSGAYSERDAQMLYKQVLEGIEYLHKESVCHRDIKPSNILITKDKSSVKLIDFNVAKKIPEGDIIMMYTKSAGTLAFAAPERLAEDCRYTEKVDMWAAGIVLFMLLTGHHPFDTTASAAKLVEQIMHGQENVQD